MRPPVGNPGSGLVLKAWSSEEDLGAGWTCKVSGPSLTSRVLGGRVHRLCWAVRLVVLGFVAGFLRELSLLPWRPLPHLPSATTSKASLQPSHPPGWVSCSLDLPPQDLPPEPLNAPQPSRHGLSGDDRWILWRRADRPLIQVIDSALIRGKRWRLYSDVCSVNI